MSCANTFFLKTHELREAAAQLRAEAVQARARILVEKRWKEITINDVFDALEIRAAKGKVVDALIYALQQKDEADAGRILLRIVTGYVQDEAAEQADNEIPDYEEANE